MTSDDDLLLLLKTEGPASAAALARRLAMTPQGLRRRLEALQAQGYLRVGAAAAAGSASGASGSATAGAGRPARFWSLTAAGHARFPDGHDQIAVELIDGIRRTLGESALEGLIAGREAEQRRRYDAALAGAATLPDRLQGLAAQRSAEGYMAAVQPQADGSFLLVEHHCPICAAATACQGFCRSELAIFRAVLGPAVAVERERHLLAGDGRCAYRVRPKKRAARPQGTRGPARRRKAAAD